MQVDQEYLDRLVANPSESLNVELKTWIDSGEPAGIAKIAKACLALRNRNGGFLVIGFDNRTLQPDVIGRPEDVRLMFHHDRIQSIISRYASASFEIAVGFGARENLEYPVIVVPQGVTAPVASKADLSDSQKNKLIRCSDVYFRTLEANGTPSTAAAKPADWEDIIQICFDNREADIGRFLRRHIGNMDLLKLMENLGATVRPTQPSLREQATVFLNDGLIRLHKAIAKRQLTDQEKEALGRGAWSVSVAIYPERLNVIADRTFQNKVFASNLSFSSWPPWVDSRGFGDTEDQPYFFENGVEALVLGLSGRMFTHADFMRLDPTGKFYLWRLLADDLTDKVQPGTALEAIYVVEDVAEVIAAGLSLAQNLDWEAGGTLGFCFRWTSVAERHLSSWDHWKWHIRAGPAHDQVIDSFIEVPMDTPLTAVAPYVQEATKRLFASFRGYEFQLSSIEKIIRDLMERR